MRPTRWSYSSLSMYEECPAKWKYAYVDKLPQPTSAAMERGTALHKLCEDVLNGAEAVPPELDKIAPLLVRLKAREAQAEKAWRLNPQWQPVPSGSWVLAIVDVHFMVDDALHIYDFKSGHPYPSHTKQLELYALIGLATYPQAQRVECGAIYIDSGKLSRRRTIERAQADPLRDDWTTRAKTLMAAQEFPPQRGGGCYWCAFKDSAGGPCSA